MTPDQQQACKALSEAGHSQRHIAQEVLGSASKKSTVGDFLRSLEQTLAPKIITIDIETSPMKGHFWRVWKENIGRNQVLEDSRVLCWAAKDLGSDTVAMCSPEDPKHWRDEEREIVLEARNILHDADIIIAHNGRAFDIPTLFTRMVYFGIDPPSPFKQVDTLKLARGVFNFPSNSLDNIASYLGLGSKMSTGGFKLWLDCMAGHEGAWDTMRDYNQHDVILLEEIYMKLRPWDKAHPNVGLYYTDEKSRCTCCGSTSLKPAGKATTNVSMFDALQCQDCGKWSRTRTNILSKLKKNNLLAGVQ